MLFHPALGHEVHQLGTHPTVRSHPGRLALRHSDEIFLDSDPIIWPFVQLYISTTKWIHLSSVSPSRISWIRVLPWVELTVEPSGVTPGTSQESSDDYTLGRSWQLGTAKSYLTVVSVHPYVVILSGGIECVLTKVCIH